MMRIECRRHGNAARVRLLSPVRSVAAGAGDERAANAARIGGYAAVFNSRSVDLGGFVEIIQPGAFRRSLDDGADVRLLASHDGLPLARRGSGTLKVWEDSVGLRFESTLEPSDPDAQRVLTKIARRDLAEMSFSFHAIRDRWERGDPPLRSLEEVELFEISLVSFPAYPATTVSGVRDVPGRDEAERDFYDRRVRIAALGGSPPRGDDLDAIRRRVRILAVS